MCQRSSLYYNPYLQEQENFRIHIHIFKGSFKSYVDRIRWLGGNRWTIKCLVLSTFRVKIVPVED